MESFSNYLFTQGILGVAVAALGFVVVYQQKKMDKKDTAHADEIRALNLLLVQTIQAHAKDYQEMAKDSQEVMSNTAQTVALLGANIEVVKERHRQ